MQLLDEGELVEPDGRADGIRERAEGAGRRNGLADPDRRFALHYLDGRGRRRYVLRDEVIQFGGKGGRRGNRAGRRRRRGVEAVQEGSAEIVELRVGGAISR